MIDVRRLPISQEPDPRKRAERERQVARMVRAERVERLGLDACRICDGTTEDVDDVTLRCVCGEVASALQARLIRKLHRSDEDREADRSDRIAP